MMLSQARIITNTLAFLRPPANLGVAEWAEINIKLSSKQSADAGKFKVRGYQHEILEAFTNPHCEKIVMMMAAQMSKSMLINLIGGYCIHHDPKSFVVLHATMSDKNKWLHGKFQPMLDDNPQIKKLMAKPRSDDGTNTSEMKDFLGGAMYLAWSGSEASLRSISVPIVICDEVDAYEMTREGCAVNLISERSKTFEDQAKIVLASTPTIKELSTIERHYLESDQRQYYIPCPHCKHMQTLKWQQIKWQKDKKGEVSYPETAKYFCEKCQKIISHRQKREIIEKGTGRWIAKYPKRTSAGFHLSELYAPFSTWEQIVKKFIKAKKTNDLQSFINTVLAETWEEMGETIRWHELYDRCEAYEDDAPAEVGYITAGVDIQKDRIEFEVVGWGMGDGSWSLDYQVIWGDTSQAEVWTELTLALDKRYHHPAGVKMPISVAMIDSSAFTRTVYQYVSTRPRNKVLAIKGLGGYKVPLLRKPTKTQVVGSRRQIDLYILGVDEAKATIYNRLSVNTPEAAGYCHFAEPHNDEVYFKQLTSEKRILHYKKGRASFEWIVTSKDKRNEALDCRVYAYAAYKLNNPNIQMRLNRIRNAGAKVYFGVQKDSIK